MAHNLHAPPAHIKPVLKPVQQIAAHAIVLSIVPTLYTVHSIVFTVNFLYSVCLFSSEQRVLLTVNPLE